jgi:hypothetical protein
VLHIVHFSGDGAGAPPHTGGSVHASTAGHFVAGEVFTAREVMQDDVVEDPWYPFNPAFEYTLVLSATAAAAHVDTWIMPDSTMALRQVNLTDGTFTIYEDNTPDADASNPATFTNGLPILAGVIPLMSCGGGLVMFSNPRPTETSGTLGFAGQAIITSGSGMSLVACPPEPDGIHLQMNDHADWGSFVPIAPGYDELYDSKWECCVPTTSVETGSWGGVKSLYR